MPAERKSYMAELDLWTDKTIIRPMLDHFIGFDRAGEESDEDWNALEAAIKKAVREKTLESFRNGQRTPPRAAKVSRGGQK
jgi:hypothetical protein